VADSLMQCVSLHTASVPTRFIDCRYRVVIDCADGLYV